MQNSGQPGADMGNLRVRGIGTLGNADAMVIIDGVESSINNVNPNDIASISVLKMQQLRLFMACEQLMV